jgi:putative toxin-antitoxin system antitoxin component (TIGR02293 family)
VLLDLLVTVNCRLPPQTLNPSFTLLIHSELMNTPTTARRQVNKKGEARDAAIVAFWDFSVNRVLLNDSERLLQIKAGFSAQLFQVIRVTFDLQGRGLERLLNASVSTLKRHSREQKPLNSVASERLDRVAVVFNLAEAVFQSRNTAAWWMSKPNKALGGDTPVMMCGTEIGGKQVRRVLQALEWGGTV